MVTTKQSAKCFSNIATRVLLTVSLVSMSSVMAQGWRFEPGVSLSEIYTDNVDLRPDDQAEDDLITELSPTIAIAYDSQRLQSTLDYRIQALAYSDQSERDNSFQQFDGTFLASLPASFFVELSASQTQQITDPQQANAFSNVPVGGGQTDVQTSSISPYWQQRFSSGLQAQLRVSQSHVDYDDDSRATVVDSEMDSATFTLSQQQAGQNYLWSFSYYKQEVTFLDSESVVIVNQAPVVIVRDLEDVFERVDAEFGLVLSNKLTLLLTAGDEDNDFGLSAADGEDPAGSSWTVGLRWTAARDFFEIKAGERFFGDTASMSWEHRGLYFNINASYAEDLFTDTQTQLDNDVFSEADGFSETSLNRPTSNVFLRKRADLSVNYNKAKTQLGLSMYNEVRDFQDSLGEETTRFLAVNWLWNMSPRMSLFVNVDARMDEFRELEREDLLQQLRVGVRRSPGPRTSLELYIQQAELDSDTAAVSTTDQNQVAAPDVSYQESSLGFTFSRAF